jgi:hypothetical protein
VVLLSAALGCDRSPRCRELSGAIGGSLQPDFARFLNDVSGAIENMIALRALPNPSLSDESM